MLYANISLRRDHPITFKFLILEVLLENIRGDNIILRREGRTKLDFTIQGQMGWVKVPKGKLAKLKNGPQEQLA